MLLLFWQLENYVTLNYNCLYPLMDHFKWDDDFGCYSPIEDVTPEMIEASQSSFDQLPMQFLSLID
jgi:hypothetical protein